MLGVAHDGDPDDPVANVSASFILLDAAIDQLPYARLLGFSTITDGDGKLIFTMPWSEAVRGRPEFLHGGAITGLLELAAIGTLQAMLANEQPVRIKPIAVTIDYMRGGRRLQTYASAQVTRIGNRIANLAAEARQDDPTRPIAAARINVLLDRR